MTTIEDLLKDAVQKLIVAGLPNARSEAEFLVAALLNKSRARLLLDRQSPVNGAGLRKIQSAIRKRAQRWPLAYITRDQPFRDLVLKITPAVLIPRPETEELVERALERIAAQKRLVRVADIGTGSGCIAISLARSPWVERVWAVDHSSAALKVAQSNSRRYQTSKHCQWIKGNLGAPLIKRGIRVDFLVANLPYIPTNDIKALEPELFREPYAALDGGADGLDLIYRMIEQAPEILNPWGRLMLEIGVHEDGAVRNLLRAGGLWDQIQIDHDLSGIGRFAEARLKG
jgi:release factor glutamine methyltransferase